MNFALSILVEFIEVEDAKSIIYERKGYAPKVPSDAQIIVMISKNFYET